MRLFLLMIFIISINIQDCYSQQNKDDFKGYVSGVSNYTCDSIINLIKKQEVIDTVSLLKPPYSFVDSQTNIVKVYNAELKDLANFNYSEKLKPFLKFYNYVNCYLYKEYNNKDTIFAGLVEGGRISSRILANSYMFGLKELNMLLGEVNINHVAIFRLKSFNYFFLLESGVVYVYIEGKLEPAIQFFKKRYSIVEFRKKFLPKEYKCEGKIEGVQKIKIKEIEKKKKVLWHKN